MSSQIGALVAAHLSDRRRSLLAWGLPLGLMSAFIVAIFPSVEDSIGQAVSEYPPALKEAFGIGELTGFANVWPLALLFAGLGIVVCAWSLRTSIVTGAVAGVLVAMYVIDLVGKLDPGLRLAPLRLGLQVLRQRDRGRDRTVGLRCGHRGGCPARRHGWVAFRAAGYFGVTTRIGSLGSGILVRWDHLIGLRAALARVAPNG